MSDFTPAYIAPASASSGPTRVNTVWIWAILVVPFLWLVIAAAIVIPMTISDPLSVLQASRSPLLVTLSLVVWVGLVVCAFLDARHLKRLDIYKPFPWGWAFLSSVIYVVGRSVVVIRQTDRGRSPLWGAIVYVVLAIIAAIVLFSVVSSIVTAP